MGSVFAQVSTELGIPIWAIVIVAAWTLVWKALALWKAARKNSRIWFVALLLINTMGLLEILYIFLFSKIKLEGKKNSNKKKKR